MGGARGGVRTGHRLAHEVRVGLHLPLHLGHALGPQALHLLHRRLHRLGVQIHPGPRPPARRPPRPWIFPAPPGGPPTPALNPRLRYILTLPPQARNLPDPSPNLLVTASPGDAPASGEEPVGAGGSLGRPPPGDGRGAGGTGGRAGGQGGRGGAGSRAAHPRSGRCLWRNSTSVHQLS